MRHDFKRIAIVGCPGSGKSTLARRLASITGLPVIHLDMEFWRPNWEQTPKDEWIDIQTGLVAQSHWIIDGNYDGTMTLRFAAADLIIFLDVNRFVCLYRVLRRRNNARPDFPAFLVEKIDWQFLKFIWNFPKKNREAIFNLHKGYPDKPFITIRNNRELNKVLEEFGEQL